MPKYYKPVFFNWELPVPSSRNHMSLSRNLKKEGLSRQINRVTLGNTNSGTLTMTGLDWAEPMAQPRPQG